jgi:tetratricopeptide (TPR) repeat protein
VSQSNTNDGYAVSERYGSASPLSELPARAVYVCESDSACASGLFSLYAERTRPDLDVVPAQHLWDPTVLRRLRGLPVAAASDRDVWPEPQQRAAAAGLRQRALLQQTHLRPVFFERVDHLPEVGLDLSHLPWVGVSRPQSVESSAAQLARLERARFGAAGPDTELARELWASAHETLGMVYSRAGQGPQAVAQFSRTVELTPLRAAARSNLGVALEQRGDLPAALIQTAHAVELDPLRPTPWVNLTRLLLRVQGPEAARAALLNASRFAVRDPRLDEIDRELDEQPEAPEE